MRAERAVAVRCSAGLAASLLMVEPETHFDLCYDLLVISERRALLAESCPSLNLATKALIAG